MSSNLHWRVNVLPSGQLGPFPGHSKFPFRIMKGPYERLKYDLRRLWECPLCKRRERTDGGVTSCFCDCGTKQEGGQLVVMRLVADGPQRLVPVTARAGGACTEEGGLPADKASGVLERPDSDGEAKNVSAEEPSEG